MDLWELRSRATREIEQSLKQECEAIEAAIALLEKFAERMIAIANEDGPEMKFASVCCQTIVKAFRLSLGCYSLCLDGLVVEARPLVRLLMEAWQLLAYFREEPTRVQEVWEGKLPTAGGIAKVLKDELHGELKGLRDYLNYNGSHMSFQKEALVSVFIPFDVENARLCFRPIFTFTMFSVYEAGKCLHVLGRLDSTLANEIILCRTKGLNIFGLVEEEE